MPTDDFVILLPWHHYVRGAHFRAHLTAPGVDGIRVDETHYTIRDAYDVHVLTAPGGKDAADTSARTAGWILLDAAPLTIGKRGVLGPWRRELGVSRRMCPVEGKLATPCLVNREGWLVSVLLEEAHAVVAQGPQTGTLGERMATAAALALGFDEAGERYPLPPLLLELDSAFKVRDLEWIERQQDEVIAAADPALLGLWLGYCALLSYMAHREDFRGARRLPAPIDAAATTLIAQQDCLWAAYLARRKQQP